MVVAGFVVVAGSVFVVVVAGFVVVAVAGFVVVVAGFVSVFAVVDAAALAPAAGMTSVCPMRSVAFGSTLFAAMRSASFTWWRYAIMLRLSPLFTT